LPPKVDPEKCIGCGTCAEVCPNGVFEVGDKCRVVRPDQCTACGRCVAECPVDAITVEAAGVGSGADTQRRHERSPGYGAAGGRKAYTLTAPPPGRSPAGPAPHRDQGLWSFFGRACPRLPGHGRGQHGGRHHHGTRRP